MNHYMDNSANAHTIRRVRRRRNLALEVYDLLCESIVEGSIIPGQRIVVESLASEIGVSATPMREALARLLQDGLVVEDPSGKLRVIPLTRSYVIDTARVRRALEGLSAELAATHISDPELEKLRKATEVNGIAISNHDYRQHRSIDRLFHQMICTAAGNSKLSRDLEALRVHIDYIRGYSQRHAGNHLNLSHQEHVAILDQLINRDPKGSRQTMELHIASSMERIAELIEFHDECGVSDELTEEGTKL